MKSIAKVTLVTLLLFAGAQLALAQQPAKKDGANRTPPGPTQMAERQTERMTKTLNLTADQSKQVQAIHLKYAQQRQAAKTAAAPTEAERKAKYEQKKAMHEQKNAELKAVLTPTQQATWEKERAEHKGKHGDKGKKGHKTKKA